jgi:hypothetical protein
MVKINSFHFGYRFIVYVRVVPVRCGTLLQPMLVKHLSTSNSIGRSLVLVSCFRDWERKEEDVEGGYFKFG